MKKSEFKTMLATVMEREGATADDVIEYMEHVGMKPPLQIKFIEGSGLELRCVWEDEND